MKTFYTGVGGWTEIQRPDGTVTFVSPAGKTYTTHPGSRIFFPNWNVTTAELPPPAEQPPPASQHGLTMPRRKRPRPIEEAARIKAERALNDSEPPPF
jgi:hypothetical protein